MDQPEEWREPVYVVAEVPISKRPAAPRMALCARLEKKWEEIQVGRQGSYSIERLESLDRYCKTTSRTRVILVCALTPVPALLIAVLVECMPLSSPTEGWKANWVFWVRVVLLITAMLFAVFSSLINFVPELNYTLTKRLLVSVAGAGAFVGMCLVTSSHIGFPVPFVWYIADLLAGIYLVSVILLVFDGNPFADKTLGYANLRRYYRYFGGCMGLNLYFGIYKSIYKGMPEAYRGGVILVLPLWKFAGKHFIMWVMRDIEDYLPEIVALTVDFFSAIFVSACISTAHSVYTSAMFVALDFAQGVLEFRELRTNARSLLRLFQDRRASRERLNSRSNRTASDLEHANLFTMMFAVTRNLSTFQMKALRGVRLWACLPHPLAKQQVERLHAFEASGMFGPIPQPEKTSSQRVFWKSSRHRIAVGPAPAKQVSPMSETSDKKANARLAASIEKSKRIISQGLQLLFHCEYLILVEYIECIIPLVFMIYRSVLAHLPNIIYYPIDVGNWGWGTVGNIMAFILSEVVSLIVFESYLRRTFAFSPLYQLAFVLEGQMYVVQSSLWTVILTLMQFELVHSGTDFTFRFEWLHNKTS